MPAIAGVRFYYFGRYSSKRGEILIQVRVEKNCPLGREACEHLLSIAVPSAGGDGMLLGVVDSEEAAHKIALAFERLFDLVK